MNIKIHGGGSGTYANAGSSASLVNYLQHEDLDRMKHGEALEPFFNQEKDNIRSQEVIYRLDHNKAQLGKADAKFYSITVSPSEKELRHLGETKAEQAQALKEYIRQALMPTYAVNFNKGLGGQDILYYAKVHHERNQETGKEDMHAHVIVSRKDMSNKLKLSPATNHRGTQKGAVKGGFDREAFVHTCEQAFDQQTGYKRDQTESFAYCHAIKNGGVAAIQEQARLRVAQEFQQRQEQKELQQAQQAEKVKQQENIQIKQVSEQRRSRGIGR
ncbi:MAG: clindamycin resistance transfer factor BtgB [Cytophagales bacterium CG18_big_fil_WC_8_21_14_2_50_42_9]|nr:MAG: clindamycin resistance transfer factor BtgB [Cytophagales bacterium CG18_big_fil_WC_8_21_14_2_50_42_9]